MDQFFTGIGQAPITVSPGPAPRIGITAATTTAAGSMSAADKAKIDGLTWAVTSTSTGGGGGGGIIFRNGSGAPVTLAGFDIWAFGSLTANDSAYYTFQIFYADITPHGFDAGSVVALASVTTKTTGGGGTGNWVSFPSDGCRVPVPATVAYMVPAGKVVLWEMTVTTGSPANFPPFQLIGY